MCIWRQCNKDPSAALGMTVLGERIGSQGGCAACLEDGILVSQPSPLREGAPQGRMGQTWYERQLGSGFPVTSHKSLHNTKERISSHAWYEILRLSPHLFWLGLFTHRAFSSAQDDDTGRADGLLFGRYVACFGTIGVIYDTSRPLEKGRAKGAGWIHEAV